jgi:hypothetical protein
MFERQSNPFRLSLTHLLLWTAATAVAVALLHQPGRTRLTTPLVLTNVAVAPVYGLAMLSVFWALSESRGTSRHFSQPGHWLLATIGAAFLGGAGMYRVGIALESGPQAPPAAAVMLGAAVVTAACLALVLVPVFVLGAMDELRHVPVWRFVFPLLAASALSITLGCCLGFSPAGRALIPLIPTGLLAVTLLTIALAAARDLIHREYRDLPHWLGVLGVFVVVGQLTIVLVVSLI